MPSQNQRILTAAADIPEGPHCWIQWKGTDVCMDVHCECGEHSHVDAEFAYKVECPRCGKVWHVSPYVRLVPWVEEDGHLDSCLVVADGDHERTTRLRNI